MLFRVPRSETSFCWQIRKNRDNLILKMKLKPSLKQKKRYVLFGIKASKVFSLAEVKEAIDSALLRFLGELGIAKAGPLLVKEKWSLEKQYFVLKVNHNYVDELKTA